MFEVSVVATSRISLSGVLWPMVMSHCEAAEREARLPLGDPIDSQVQHAASAIILAVTCAEAYINEFILDSSTSIGEAEIGNSPSDKSYRPKDKWRDVMRQATGDHEVAGCAPIQDLGFLVDLRNLLAHYLPEDRVIGATPGTPIPVETQLHQEEARLERFIGRRVRLGQRCPNNQFLHSVLCGPSALWAVDTVQACVQQLFDSTGGDRPAGVGSNVPHTRDSVLAPTGS